MMQTRLLQLVIAVLLAALISAPLAMADNAPAVEDVLEDTAEQLHETESMAFVMELEGTTYVDDAETIQLVGAEGIMQRPDRVDVVFTAIFLGQQQISIRMITIGEEAWITDLVTGKWVPSPPEFGYNPAVLYDDEHGLGPVMSRMSDSEITGSEEVDGRDAWLITATVDGDVTKAMTSDTLRGSELDLELWIDQDTNDLLQIRLHEPTDEDLEDPATWTLILSDHNEDVEIEQPN